MYVTITDYGALHIHYVIESSAVFQEKETNVDLMHILVGRDGDISTNKFFWFENHILSNILLKKTNVQNDLVKQWEVYS